ncbi:orotidine-5'-phosphate decarboxylase [Lactobacillus bombicola]|jgi:orotidine-5'-phosphate decarboxylase|uniref:Orotidine 5'-phosphate decarboxylase n=1 Tax=Lactobacillus bombicola TaxID=1505723 RepID=A0A1I1S5S0_9LACO|nr:orotidine-5'-phosphate decarboxylase [Lactobacillus bombicola]MCO6527982.1 orotidine-5'-phosphate decarboxylase [Lactobacillus sp.]RHW51007.1 orotidine-5'-phosphate decarboxylase [Lactobacillus bombicola]RHW52734.1 orotidine-5'-phosphate decarboxylase [Lactobacillus bombicola]RHW55288.1 orotidine-5'-phosphate decarboxylase [Lactobacillus bombicola]SFD41851.1 orotidine-5'-phosphate decarboxylase [Lactobacillus bombicola]
MEKAVFIALDYDREEDAQNLLMKLGSADKTYLKIGMELFYHSGSHFVKQLVEQGYHIFLDLKLHDIPNTVYRAAKQLAQLGVFCITIHALGGSEMIMAAKKGLVAGTPKGMKPPKLLAVTELTSISDAILRNEQNCSLSMTKQVVSLAQTAKKAGADGVICSPLEVTSLQKIIGTDFLYVTPGIRLANNQNGDQKRVATPKQAKDYGASAIVVGRPITTATDPASVYQIIKKEFN